MSSELWAENPELQKRYQKILAETRRLQAELGVESRSLSERYADMLERKEQERQAHEQLKLLSSIPKPKLNFKRR